MHINIRCFFSYLQMKYEKIKKLKINKYIFQVICFDWSFKKIKKDAVR